MKDLQIDKSTEKNNRVAIRKMLQPLRGPIFKTDLQYPDMDVREAVVNLYEWSKKDGCLPQTLRAAYDLHSYVGFNLEDHAAGMTALSADEARDSRPFTLNEDQLSTAEALEAVCLHCRKVCRDLQIDPNKAYMLHDGSPAPRRESRQRSGNGRRAHDFNRKNASRQSIEEFKSLRREKNRIATDAILNCVPRVATPAEDQPVIDALTEALNSRVREDNFRLDPTGCYGATITVVKDFEGNYDVRINDGMCMPNSKFEVVGLIYLRRRLTYSDPEGILYGESYLISCKPVCESVLREFNNKPEDNSQYTTEIPE